MKVVWMLVIVLTLAAMGYAPLNELNRNANPPDGHIPEKEWIQSLSGEMETLPEEKEKADVSFRLDVTEEKRLTSEIRPAKEIITLDPEMERELLAKKKPLQGLFETAMETRYSDGLIDIHFSIINISGKELQIFQGSGQQYDIWVYNENGEEVYRWSYDKAFIQAIIELDFNENAEMLFAERWNLRDNEGNPVPPGKYTIAVQVMFGIYSGMVSLNELTARSVVEIN